MRKHTVSFPDALWEALEEEAIRQGKTIGQLVRDGSRAQLRYAAATREKNARRLTAREVFGP